MGSGGDVSSAECRSSFVFWLKGLEQVTSGLEQVKSGVMQANANERRGHF